MAVNLYTSTIFPYLYIQGCVVTVPAGNSSTVAVISPGQLRDDTDSSNVIVSNTLNVSMFVVGANGLDTGEVSASTLYNVFVISDPSGRLPAAGLLSLNADAPIMPTSLGITYSQKRWVGAVSVNSTATSLVTQYTAGAGSTRIVSYDVNANDCLVFSGIVPVSPATVDLSKVCPIGPSSFQTSVIGIFGATGNSPDPVDAVYLGTLYNDLNTTTFQSMLISVADTNQSWVSLMVPTLNATIYQKAVVTAGPFTLYLGMTGYQYTV